MIRGGLTQPNRESQTHGELRRKKRLSYAVVHSCLKEPQPLLKFEVPGKDEQRHVTILLP